MMERESDKNVPSKAFDSWWQAGHMAMRPIGGQPHDAEKIWTAAWEAAQRAQGAPPPSTAAAGETPRKVVKFRANRILNEDEIKEGWKPIPIDVVLFKDYAQLASDLAEARKMHGEAIAEWAKWEGEAKRLSAPSTDGFYEKLWKDFVSIQRGDAVGTCEKVEAWYRAGQPSATQPPASAGETPSEVQEWRGHMDLHLTEHDLPHAGKALRAAWPHVSAYLVSVENERNTWRELAKNAEARLSAIVALGWREVSEDAAKSGPMVLPDMPLHYFARCGGRYYQYTVPTLIVNVDGGRKA